MGIINEDLKPRYTRRSNPDGHYNLTIVEEQELPTALLCKYSYDKLFKSAIFDIQHEKSSPHKDMKNRMAKNRPQFEKTLEEHLERVDTDLKHWNRPLIEKLQQLFKKPIYYCYERISEHWHQGILTESATYFHFTMFHNDKKRITADENFQNRTIVFWLFDDKMIFAYEEGKDTQ